MKNRKVENNMDTATSMGPVVMALFTYGICIVISLGVAGIIKVLFAVINVRQKRIAEKAAAATPHT